MKYEKTKLFWKADDNAMHVYCIPYDDNDDYYDFLRKYREKGYKQIIVTAEIMIDIIKYACLNKNCRINKIEFIEEDDALDYEVNVILQLMAQNPAYLNELIEKIKFLEEKSSIDLKRIYVRSLHEEGGASFFVQANGIIGISQGAYDCMSKEISSIVERSLFQ